MRKVAHNSYYAYAIGLNALLRGREQSLQTLTPESKIEMYH